MWESVKKFPCTANRNFIIHIDNLKSVYSKGQLIQRLKTIFDEEKLKKQSSRTVFEKIEPIPGVGRSRVFPRPNDMIVEDVPNVHLEYENLDLLLKLYSKISYNDDLKNAFLEWLGVLFETEIGTRDIGLLSGTYNLGLAVHFLFKIDRLDLLEDFIDDRLKKKLTCREIIQSLNLILRYEHYKIDETRLDTLERLTKKIFDKGGFVELDTGRIIHNLRAYRLKKEFSEDINYEINQDKEKVQDYISKYGFGSELSGALKKIEEANFSASEEEFDFRNNISLLREFFNKLTRSISKEIGRNCGENPENWTTEKIHEFIGKKLSFSTGERKIMAALNKSLNEETHGLLSKKEKFRLAKNFTIEFSLLSLTKLEAWKESVSKS